MRLRSRILVAAAAVLAALFQQLHGWLTAAPYDRAPSAKLEVNSREERGDGGDSVAAPLGSAAPLPTFAASAPAVPALESEEARTPPLDGTRNLLIVGRDLRADGHGAALADTIVVVVLDERSGHVGLVSVPRDLYVDIPGHGLDRINAVFSVARRSKQKPLELLARVIEDTLALPIEHGLALDLGLFERAVDRVGGVEVRVPCAIADSFIDGRADGGRRRLDVPEGIVHMDGVTASMYVRSRHGRSDWDRARRQQAVLVGLRDRLSGASGGALLPELWTTFEGALETDMRRIDMIRLADRALSIDPRHLHGLVLGHAHTEGQMTAEGRAVLVPKFDAIHEAVAHLFSAPAPGTPLPGAKCAAKDAALGS